MAAPKFISPSQQDGIAAATEEVQLAYAADLVRECAAALRLSQPISMSAQLLLHRFYTRVSLRAHCSMWAVGAAVLLAAKLADEPRSLRHVANVLHDRFTLRERASKMVVWKGQQKRRPLDFYGAAGYDWKYELISTERHLLKELGFRVLVELPHKFVLIFVNTLREKSRTCAWTDAKVQEFRKLLQYAWNYANDCMRLRVCVAEEPESIACACISLGESHCRGKLPEGWQIAFGSSPEESMRIAHEIEESYKAIPSTEERFVDFSESPAFKPYHPSKRVAANDETTARTYNVPNDPEEMHRRKRLRTDEKSKTG